MMIGVLVMLNNYFHDVASGLLLCCAVTMMLLLRRVNVDSGPQVDRFIVEIYGHISKIAAASLVWIVIGGIVRTAAYRNYEWSDAAGREQIPALILKHIIFLILVSGGAYYWRKLSVEINKLKIRNTGNVQ